MNSITKMAEAVKYFEMAIEEMKEGCDTFFLPFSRLPIPER
ncbi:MAG: hypothetical protein WC279_08305 [Sulfurimonas sp.]